MRYSIPLVSLHFQILLSVSNLLSVAKPVFFTNSVGGFFFSLFDKVTLCFTIKILRSLISSKKKPAYFCVLFYFLNLYLLQVQLKTISMYDFMIPSKKLIN